MSSIRPLKKTPLTSALSQVYGVATRIKYLWHKILPPSQRGIPTISVGGISAGGTGKTPLTKLLIQSFIDEGYTPVLFSRGYGRKEQKTVVLPPGSEVSWEEVGDEPAMLRRAIPKLWLAIDGNRRRAERVLRKQLPENPVFILDDGFQHMPFFRHCDIVTLPPKIAEDNLIPCGFLREPLSSLKRADLITTIDATDEETGEIENLLKSFQISAPLVHLRKKEQEWIHSQTGERRETLQNPTALIAAIARPERFLEDAYRRCSSIESVLLFPDHHPFTKEEHKIFSEIDLPAIGTTEKDLIRIFSENYEYHKKMWYLTADIDFKTGLHETIFYNTIYKKIKDIL